MTQLILFLGMTIISSQLEREIAEAFETYRRHMAELEEEQRALVVGWIEMHEEEAMTKLRQEIGRPEKLK